MDEKGFFLGFVQRSVRVLVKAPEKTAFPRQSGQQEMMTALGAVGAFELEIPFISHVHRRILWTRSGCNIISLYSDWMLPLSLFMWSECDSITVPSPTFNTDSPSSWVRSRYRHRAVLSRHGVTESPWRWLAVKLFSCDLCERQVAAKRGYPITSTTVFLSIDSGFLCLRVGNGSAAFTRV